MADSSDKEEEEQVRNGGGASPRTLLAIQQALAEEEDGLVQQAVVISDSPVGTRHQAPPVVLSSSDEEPESHTGKTLPQESIKWNKTHQSLHMRDGLLASSSEDEADEVIGERNRDLQLLRPRQKGGMKSNDESDEGQLTEAVKQGQMEKQLELEEKVPLSGLTCAQPRDADADPTEAPEKADETSEASEESDSEGRFISVFAVVLHYSAN